MRVRDRLETSHQANQDHQRIISETNVMGTVLRCDLSGSGVISWVGMESEPNIVGKPAGVVSSGFYVSDRRHPGLICLKLRSTRLQK